MIVQFFRYGNGMSKGPLNYLLGKDRKRDHAKILSGDEQEIAGLIDSSPYAKKYTCGCLSFYENDFSDQEKKEMMSDFEKCLFPGMDQDQYRVLWIEHKDKQNPETGESRLELNFLIPNTEILTGQRLQPFFHKADLSRVDLFKKITNFEYDLHDPNDPLYRQDITSKKSLPKSVAEIKTVLDLEAKKAIEKGLINDRQSMKKWLTDIGLEIVRETERNISIKNPHDDEKIKNPHDDKKARSIRLTGAVYEQDFRLTKKSAELTREASREYRQEARERYESDIQRYTKYIKQKSKELERKYRKHETEPSDIPERSPNKDYRPDQYGYEGDNRQAEAINQGAFEFTAEKYRSIKSELERVQSIKPRNSSTSDAEKSPFYIKYSPDFCDMYSDYQQYLSRLLQQNEIRRIKSNKSITSDRKTELGRIEAGFNFEQSRVEEEISINRSQGVNDDPRSTVIADHRAAAKTARESIRALGTSSNDYRAIEDFQQQIWRTKQFINAENQRVNRNSNEVKESSDIREFITKLGEQLRTAITEQFKAVSDFFKSREPNQGVDNEQSPEHGAERNQNSVEAINIGVFERERENQGIPRQPRELNRDLVYTALNELDRRKKIHYDRVNEQNNDSPSPF